MSKKTIALFILALAFSDAVAEGTSGSGGNGTPSGTISGGGVLITPIPPPIKGRPKAPSAQVVEASYEDGYLYLSFKYSEGPAVLYVYDADQTTLRSQQVFSTDSEAAVYIGSVTDSYLLIETANGHEYEGWIY